MKLSLYVLDEACSTHVRYEKFIENFISEAPKRRAHLGDSGADRKIILN
jgi:hypothetical protein